MVPASGVTHHCFDFSDIRLTRHIDPLPFDCLTSSDLVHSVLFTIEHQLLLPTFRMGPSASPSVAFKQMPTPRNQ
jgi:hypothetical protein